MSDTEGEDPQPGYLARIRERCDALGLSEHAVSVAAFGHNKGISHLKKGTRSPGLEIFVKLARVLEVSASWLAYGGGDATPMARPVRGPVLAYAGEVAAGQWLDQETTFTPPKRGPAIAPNPRWPTAAQYVVSVRGTSIDAVAPDGAALACVDPREISYAAQNGDLVIVERRRNGGSEIERTAKRYRRTGATFELWPQSSDPSHKPIKVDPSVQDEATEIEIVGLADRCVQVIDLAFPWERDDAGAA